jgi:hypothetical protein|tara:strand:+ start:181 stop:411 length:231 start_codon:yes stop_codon:yes gene_type:complete
MSKLLELIIKEQERLKESGWVPKFRGDTGVNAAQLMIDNNVELRDEFDKSFVEGFKELTEDNWCHYSGMPSPEAYK